MRFVWTIVGLIVLLTGRATVSSETIGTGIIDDGSEGNQDTGPPDPPVDPPGSQVHRETPPKQQGPESLASRPIVERGVQDEKEERNATEPPGLWDIFLPWMNLARVARQSNQNETAALATEKRNSMDESGPKNVRIDGTVARVERESKDARGGSKDEDLEGAEQGLGLGYFYWNPHPFYGARPWPPYRRRYYDRYLRYPIFTG